MKPDYLWDRSGEPDPEIQRLERLLGTLRSRRPAPEFSARAARPESGWRLLPIAAAILLAVAASWIATRGSVAGGWEVSRVEGAPRVGAGIIGGTGRLEVGQWLETDRTARARVAVGEIGQLDIEPNTRVRLLKARAEEHRISIERGEIHAMIWAPPRRFFVDTPSASAVDLGCKYTLKVNDRGEGLLQVEFGWVAFERDGRESFIPAGAACHTRPGIGPGTPYYETAATSLQDALEQFDFRNGGRAALEIVLNAARKEDAMTLWHLLSRVQPPERAAVYDRLSALAPPPAGVTREGILAANREMLDQWWNALGLEDTTWWRMWKGSYPGK